MTYQLFFGLPQLQQSSFLRRRLYCLRDRQYCLSFLQRCSLRARSRKCLKLVHTGPHYAPLTRTPWSVFRKILSELRNVRGQFDPEKKAHVAIFLDVLTSVLVLWATIGRDLRRIYDPSMTKQTFETVFKYYIWGGRESYQIKQQIRERLPNQNGNQTPELPAWDALVDFAGLQLSAPQHLMECAHVCREFSIREMLSRSESHDRRLAATLGQNSRVRQLSVALSDYLVAAGGLPTDFAKRVQRIVLSDPTA